MVLRIEIRNSFMFVYGSWHPEGHLCCPGKLSDGEIHKWHISYGFVYPKLCDLTYGYEYPEDKNFKSLRTKRIFHVNELGTGLNWRGAGRINHFFKKTISKNIWQILPHLHYSFLHHPIVEIESRVVY